MASKKKKKQKYYNENIGRDIDYEENKQVKYYDSKKKDFVVVSDRDFQTMEAEDDYNREQEHLENVKKQKEEYDRFKKRGFSDEKINAIRDTKFNMDMAELFGEEEKYNELKELYDYNVLRPNFSKGQKALATAGKMVSNLGKPIVSNLEATAKLPSYVLGQAYNSARDLLNVDSEKESDKRYKNTRENYENNMITKTLFDNSGIDMARYNNIATDVGNVASSGIGGLLSLGLGVKAGGALGLSDDVASFATFLPSNLQESVSSGKTGVDALLDSSLKSLISSQVEKIGGIKFGKNGINFEKKLPKQILDEAVEEIVESNLLDTYQNARSLFDQNTQSVGIKDLINNAGNSALMSLPTTAIFGGANAFGNRINNRGNNLTNVVKTNEPKKKQNKNSQDIQSVLDEIKNGKKVTTTNNGLSDEEIIKKALAKQAIDEETTTNEVETKPKETTKRPLPTKKKQQVVEETKVEEPKPIEETKVEEPKQPETETEPNIKETELNEIKQDAKQEVKPEVKPEEPQLNKQNEKIKLKEEIKPVLPIKKKEQNIETKIESQLPTKDKPLTKKQQRNNAIKTYHDTIVTKNKDAKFEDGTYPRIVENNVQPNDYSKTSANIVNNHTQETLNNVPATLITYNDDGTQNRYTYADRGQLLQAVKKEYGGFNKIGNKYSIQTTPENGEFNLVRSKLAKGGWEWRNSNNEFVQTETTKSYKATKPLNKEKMEMEMEADYFNSVLEHNSMMKRTDKAIKELQRSGLKTSQADLETRKKMVTRNIDGLDKRLSVATKKSDIDKIITTSENSYVNYVHSGGDRIPEIENKLINARSRQQAKKGVEKGEITFDTLKKELDNRINNKDNKMPLDIQKFASNKKNLMPLDIQLFNEKPKISDTVVALEENKTYVAKPKIEKGDKIGKTIENIEKEVVKNPAILSKAYDVGLNKADMNKRLIKKDSKSTAIIEFINENKYLQDIDKRNGNNNVIEAKLQNDNATTQGLYNILNKQTNIENEEVGDGFREITKLYQALDTDMQQSYTTLAHLYMDQAERKNTKISGETYKNTVYPEYNDKQIDAIIEAFEQERPEFTKMVKKELTDLQSFYENMNKMLVNSGIMSEKTEVSLKVAKDLLKLDEEYIKENKKDNGKIVIGTVYYLRKRNPYYFHTERIYAVGKNITDSNGVGVKGVKGRTGEATQAIQPFGYGCEKGILDNFIKVRKNELYKNIYLSDKDNMYDIKMKKPKDNLDLETLEDGVKAMSFYFNGKVKTVGISDEIYKTLKKDSTNIHNIVDTYTPKAIQAVNRISKDLLTSYNPDFISRNLLADTGIATWRSEYSLPKRTKGMNDAVVSMMSNDKYWREYKASGLVKNKNFNLDSRTISKDKSILHGISNKLNYLADMGENLTRFTEFRLDRTNGKSNSQAVYSAKTITTDFSNSGRTAKSLDKGYTRFLGASEAGFNNIVNNLGRKYNAIKKKATGQKMTEFEKTTFKKTVRNLGRLVAMGITMETANSLMYDDDKEYANRISKIPKYIRQNNFIIPVGNDGDYVSIRVARELTPLKSIYSTVFTNSKVNEYDKITIIDGVKIAVENSGPNSLTDSNIFSGIVQAIKNEDRYGNEIRKSYKTDEENAKATATHLFKNYGGLIKDITKMVNEKNNENNIPVIKSFYHKTSIKDYESKYYKIIDTYKNSNDPIEKMKYNSYYYDYKNVKDYKDKYYALIESGASSYEISNAEYQYKTALSELTDKEENFMDNGDTINYRGYRYDKKEKNGEITYRKKRSE